jgi:hypothetical protein
MFLSFFQNLLQYEHSIHGAPSLSEAALTFLYDSFTVSV